MPDIKANWSPNCRLYVPVHAEKYIGKNKRIIARSGWEIHMMKFLDHDSCVLEWCSECIGIKYQCPIDPIKSNGTPRIRTYYPDFYVVIRNNEGEIERFVVEVKPNKETKAPRKSKNPRRMLTEQVTYKTNLAKWAAAERFCKNNNMKFKIITEKQLFPGGRKS